MVFYIYAIFQQDFEALGMGTEVAKVNETEFEIEVLKKFIENDLEGGIFVEILQKKEDNLRLMS